MSFSHASAAVGKRIDQDKRPAKAGEPQTLPTNATEANPPVRDPPGRPSQARPGRMDARVMANGHGEVKRFRKEP